MSLRAAARVRVSNDDAGALRFDELRSEAPIALRPTRSALHVVGTAASPVAADDVALDVVVGPGARLDLRSVAATVAWRGQGSRSTVRARVEPGGALRWRPEPFVATAGCDHVAVAEVDLEPGASLWWEERLVLGRSGELPGSLRSVVRVDIGGAPLLRHELRVGRSAPWWHGPAVCGGYRAVGLIVAAGPAATTGAPGGPDAAGGEVPGAVWGVMPLDGPGVLVAACASGAIELDGALAAAAVAADLDPGR